MVQLFKRWAAVAAGIVVGFSVGFLTTPSQAREVVNFTQPHQAGTIVINTKEKRLYYVLGQGRAIRYPIAVGMHGRVWRGATQIVRKAVDPVWSPPAEVRRDKPNLPHLIPPGPRNPLGPRAMLLGNGEYAIHGTNNPSSIGRNASYGCIRMHNEHVIDLYNRVDVGTPVIAY